MALGNLLQQKRSTLVSLRSAYSAFLSTLSAASNKALEAVEHDDDPPFGLSKPEELTVRSDAIELDDEETDSEDETRCKYKRLVGPAAGIYHGHIPKGAMNILKTLRTHGFGAYLVGGCLRDTLLKKIPKDYDIITTAELKQVKKTFTRSLIVGRSFPVCHVNSFGEILEVSSFSTAGPGGKYIKTLRYSVEDSLSKDDMVRWNDAVRRDFTINGFLYDPFEETLYDYVGGLADLGKKKVRTIIPPHESFREDPARLLRGLRIAARLGFRFSRETSQAVKTFKGFVGTLNQARLMQELNTMMAYGAAAPSMRLLWKYDYLDILLPVQGSYFERVKMKRSSKPRKNLLTDLLTILDKFVTPDSPCPQVLWVAILALHLAVEDKRSHLGVTAAVLALRHQNMNAAVSELCKFESMLKEGTVAVNESYFDRSLSLDENTIVAEALQIIEDAIRWLTRMHGQHEDAPSIHGSLISRMVYARVHKLLAGARDRVRSESLFEKRATTELLRKQALKNGASVEVVYVLSCIFLNILYLDPHRNVFLFK